MRSPGALVCGVAGLAYVPLAALEGADVLAAPELGDGAPVVRQYLDDGGDAIALTMSAGLVSLVAYAVFAVGLFRLLQSDPAHRAPWPVVGLLGALGSTLLAAAGQIVGVVLLARRGEFGDDAVTSLWDLSIDARTWAGLVGAVGLAGFGMADRSAGVMPRVLARVAMGLAPLLLVAAVVAVIDHGEVSRLVVVGVFGVAAMWVFFVSAWLVLGHGRFSHGVPHWSLLLRQVVCLVLVAAAGVTGVALVLLPSATAQLFSWGLAPRPLASLVGACYLASAIVFAVAARAPSRQVRGLMIAALVFASSTVVVSLTHTEVFDFDRLQAVAWMMLFPAFALAVLVALVTEPDTRVADAGPRLGTVPRVAAALLAAVLIGGAITLWIDPLAANDILPYPLPPMGGRFVGSWLALLAVTAGSVVRRAAVADTRVPALALVAFPAGALIAAARVPTDLVGGWRTAGYLVAMVLVAAFGTWLATVGGQRQRAAEPGPCPRGA
ncbi:MAG: hypothetical protein AB7Q42_08230 [Acidimicrobiia bacterium]